MKIDKCFSNVWRYLFSLVDVSSCVFSNYPSAIEPAHAHPTPNECPCEVDIIGEDDSSMHEFIKKCLNNL